MAKKDIEEYHSKRDLNIYRQKIYDHLKWAKDSNYSNFSPQERIDFVTKAFSNVNHMYSKKFKLDPHDTQFGFSTGVNSLSSMWPVYNAVSMPIAFALTDDPKDIYLTLMHEMRHVVQFCTTFGAVARKLSFYSLRSTKYVDDAWEASLEEIDADNSSFYNMLKISRLGLLKSQDKVEAKRDFFDTVSQWGARTRKHLSGTANFFFRDIPQELLRNCSEKVVDIISNIKHPKQDKDLEDSKTTKTGAKAQSDDTCDKVTYEKYENVTGFMRDKLIFYTPEQVKSLINGHEECFSPLALTKQGLNGIKLIKQFGEENILRQKGLNFFGVYDEGRRYPDEERFARFDIDGLEKYEANAIMNVYAERFNQAHESDYREIEQKQQSDKAFVELKKAMADADEENLKEVFSGENADLFSNAEAL